VLLEHDNVDSRTRHQEAEHHPGGTAADNRKPGADRLAHREPLYPVNRHREKENEVGAAAIGLIREFG
jgi:hypothetical protein